jgi:hypothetical protein
VPGLSEDFRDCPTNVGIVGGRDMHSLREQQGRADLEHRVRGHIEEELRLTPMVSGRGTSAMEFKAAETSDDACDEVLCDQGSASGTTRY